MNSGNCLGLATFCLLTLYNCLVVVDFVPYSDGYFYGLLLVGFGFGMLGSFQAHKVSSEAEARPQRTLPRSVLWMKGAGLTLTAPFWIPAGLPILGGLCLSALRGKGSFRSRLTAKMKNAKRLFNGVLGILLCFLGGPISWYIASMLGFVVCLAQGDWNEEYFRVISFPFWFVLLH